MKVHFVNPLLYYQKTAKITSPGLLGIPVFNSPNKNGSKHTITHKIIQIQTTSLLGSVDKWHQQKKYRKKNSTTGPLNQWPVEPFTNPSTGSPWTQTSTSTWPPKKPTHRPPSRQLKSRRNPPDYVVQTLTWGPEGRKFSDLTIETILFWGWPTGPAGSLVAIICHQIHGNP